MDTEVTRDQLAPSNVTVRPAEEFRDHHDAAAIEEILHASIDDHAESSSDACPDQPSLAEQFAGIVYFSEKVADSHADRRSASHRGHRSPARPWRLPAANRKPKN